MDRALILENAPGNRIDGRGNQRNFRDLTDHQRLLQHSKWIQQNEFESGGDSSYTKGTGNYNQFRRGRLDGYMVIENITYAESGKYECAVDTAVGTIYATSEVFIHGTPGPPGGVTAHNLLSNSGTILWTDGVIYGSVITSYRIEGRTNHNQTWVILADRYVYHQ